MLSKDINGHYIVTVLYKSGNRMTGRFSEFSLKGGIYEWKETPNKDYPRMILELGGPHVESVWYKVEK